MTLIIGEKEVTLNFGVNQFYEDYKSDSGHDIVKDPELSLLDLGSVELFKFIQSVIWAGYQSDCFIKKVPTALTREDIRYYVMSMADTDATEVLYKLLAALSGRSVDELKKIEPDEKKN